MRVPTGVPGGGVWGRVQMGATAGVVPVEKDRTWAEFCSESTVLEKENSLSLTEFWANSVSSAKNSVSSLWHTNNRPRGIR